MLQRVFQLFELSVQWVLFVRRWVFFSVVFIGFFILFMAFICFVEMCPKPNETRNALSKKSHVEDLGGVPGLFQALTEETDEEDDKWTVFTFPVDFDAPFFGEKNENEYKYILRKFFFSFLFQFFQWNFQMIVWVCHFSFQIQPIKNWTRVWKHAKIKLHTTVRLFICHNVYRGINANKIAKAWEQQVIGELLNRCQFKRFQCVRNKNLIEIFSFWFVLVRSIFSWFHDSCCECVGSTCINYGINESRCTQCPESKDEDLDELPHEDQLEFGESHGAMAEIDKNF